MNDQPTAPDVQSLDTQAIGTFLKVNPDIDLKTFNFFRPGAMEAPWRGSSRLGRYEKINLARKFLPGQGRSISELRRCAGTELSSALG